MARPSHDDVLKAFNDQLDKAEKAWKPHLLQFQHNYDQYLNNPAKTRKEKAKDAMYVHHVYQQIETIVPRMVTPDPKFDLDPREHQDEEQVKITQAKVDYDLERDRFVEKQVQNAKTTLICGITVNKVIWEKRECVTSYHDWEGDDEMPVKQKKYLEKNGPSMIPVNLFDFFPEPGPTAIEEMDHVFHRSWLTEEELKARADLKGADGKALYKNINRAIANGPHGAQGEKELSNERPEDAEGRRGNRFEVIERWKRGRLTTVVNRSTVIRDCSNPYWHGQLPFVAASSQPDLRSFVGISEIEVIENIVRMIHKFENLRMRAAEFAVNPVLKMRRGMKGGHSIDWRPGAQLYLDRPDDIQTEIPNTNLQAGWAEVQAYLGYMQQVSGVSPFIAGADPATSGVNQETATGASILQAEANKRLALKLLQMQVMYSKVAKMFVQLNQQFMTKPEAVRIVGADGVKWVQVKPEDIAGEYDVRSTNSTESLAKSGEIQRLNDVIMTLQPFAGMPMADGSQVDMKYPIKKLLDTIGIDGDKCFTVPQPTFTPPPNMIAEPTNPELLNG